MSKLTEEDVKLRFITPAITETAGWRKEQLRMELVIAPGQVIVQGTKTKRGEISKADYVLLGSKSRKPLAVVEAKGHGAHCSCRSAAGTRLCREA